MVFTIEGLFEVAVESWPEWALNPRPLNRLSYQAMSSTRTQSQPCTATPISSFVALSNTFLVVGMLPNN